MKLPELLKMNEGKSLEFKRDLSSSDGIIKTLVAFANTAGGVMVIGVEDETRKARGLVDALDDEERLANIIADSIKPLLVPDIEIVNWQRKSLLLVQVHSSNTKPHYSARKGSEDGVYVRVGSTNRVASKAQIAELKRLNRMESFDEQALPELTPKDLDLVGAEEMIREYVPRAAGVWETLKVVTKYQGRSVPTVGGFLLFGKDRFAVFPDAWIQVGCFAGTNKVKVKDSAEIRTPLPRAVEEVIWFAQKHLMMETVISKIRREERWSIPVVAIREAVMNAVVHADYAQQGAPIRMAIFDDRIEIDNPGMLAFGLTLDDIQNGVSKLRNRVIGRIFHKLRLIEEFGSGIQRMNAECESAGLPPPLLQEFGSHFRVTFRRHAVAAPKLDRLDEKLLRVLNKRGPLNTARIAKAAGLSDRATLTRLKRLMLRGLISEISAGPHDPKRQYAVLS